ncbi:hypothetical protein P3T21_001034 [Paraburkholderia sp. GAS334]
MLGAHRNVNTWFSATLGRTLGQPQKFFVHVGVVRSRRYERGVLLRLR